MPRISVVISSYNFEPYIGECIESILNQTLQPFEIIISDDCSQDNSWNIIQAYQSRYPQLIKANRNEKNLGAWRNGNLSKQKATGELIAWMDGDDRWLPELLEFQWQALQDHPEAAFSYSNIFRIDEQGKRIGIWYAGIGQPPPSGDVFVQVYSRKFFPTHRSIFRNQLMYRNALEDVGYSDPTLVSFWDWDGKVRLTAKYKGVYTGEPLAEYRKHKGGFSQTYPEEGIQALIQVYEKNQVLLKSRTAEEVAYIKLSLESLIALRQLNLNKSLRDADYTVFAVFDRNRKLMEALPEDKCKHLETELSEEFTQLAVRIARDEFLKFNVRTGMDYLSKASRYRRQDIINRKLLKVLLPTWALRRTIKLRNLFKRYVDNVS
jgi:glycosyltransferase involved in cell wall biosynthesis